MSNISLLDCTLRDGGYINQWKFGEHTIRTICENLISSNIDIIEAGFLTDLPHTGEQSLYSGEEELFKVFPRRKGNVKVAAMIALGEKEMNPERLPDRQESILDIVRLTFHNDDAEQQRALNFAKCLMKKGYLVCMQPVGTTAYTDVELVNLIEKMNALNPYAFYLVDTLGLLYKQDLLRLLYLIDHNLKPGVCIGFHSHNNVQMSFANAQEISEFQSDRQFIVDCSVYGMGRGAGNLCTEIMAEFINKTCGEKYNILPLLEIIDECLMPIFAQNSWGYSAAYFLSAVKECHPNYSTYLLSRQTLQVGDIGKILRQIPFEERPLFNKKLIDKLYLAYQESAVDDNQARELLKVRIQNQDILLIGPGKSILVEREKILNFIEKRHPCVIAVNFIPEFPLNFTFISNQKRYSALSLKGQEDIVFTSNVKLRPQNSLTINYSSLLNADDYIYDNAGLMLIELLKQLGVSKVYLAGFDGFVHDQTKNYYDHTQMGIMEQERLEQINRSIEFQFEKIRQTMDLEFLTQTHYNLRK